MNLNKIEHFSKVSLYQKKVPKLRQCSARFDSLAHNRAMPAKWVFIETVKLKDVPQNVALVRVHRFREGTAI